MLLCATAGGHALSRGNFTVTSVEEGGSQFAAGVSVTGADVTATATLFSAAEADWSHRPLEFGVAADVLASDAWYAGSFAADRYDNLVVDDAGVSLAGVVRDPDADGEAAARAEAAAAMAAYDAAVAASDADPSSATKRLAVDEARDALREAGRREGNCVLLTGRWRAGVRYELEFTAPNPPNATAAGSLGVWAAPVSYSRRGDVVRYRVRASKRGRVCTPRDGIATAVYDACAAAVSAGVLAASAATDPDACETALAGVSSFTLSNGQTVAAAADPGALGVTSCDSAAGYARSSRFGGECVWCGAGEVASGGASCSCDATRLALPSGAVHCGGNRSVGGATSSTGLKAELCASFGGELERLHAGNLSDALVNAAYVDAFAGSARPLLDDAAMDTARAAYDAELLWDERREDTPTRRTGVGPTCAGCELTGSFADAVSGATTPVRDRRFDASHTLRFLGYVLSETLGHECPALFDPAQPFRPAYGPYQDELCGA